MSLSSLIAEYLDFQIPEYIPRESTAIEVFKVGHRSEVCD